MVSAKPHPAVERVRRVRPAAPGRFFTPAEVAELLDVEEARVVRLIELGKGEIFPGAFEDPRGSGRWLIPAPDVRAVVGGGGGVERLYSMRRFAELVGLSYFTVFRATKDRPGRPAQIRTVSILGECRVPESEYWRLTRQRPRRAAVA